MSIIESYPHVEYLVEDDRPAEVLQQEILPLFRPLHIIRAQRGEVGVMQWCADGGDVMRKYGEPTLTPKTKYFSSTAAFMRETLPFCGAFVMRVAGADATAGRMIVELGVMEFAVPQFKRDEAGKYVLDTAGNPQAVNSEGAIISTLPPEATTEQKKQATVAGYKLKWKVSAAPSGAQGEVDWDKLTPTTVAGDGEDVGKSWTFYPMFTMVATSVGAWGNNFGIKLYIESDKNDIIRLTGNNTMMATIAAVELSDGSSTPVAKRNKYGDLSTVFAIRPDCQDYSTGVDISFKEVMQRSYKDGYELPVKIGYYPASFKAIGDLILAKDTELATEFAGSDPALVGYMVDLMRGQYPNGAPLRAVTMVKPTASITDAVVLNSSTVNYMFSGADGDITDAKVEELIQATLKDTANPNMIDELRYPFNYLIDTGYSLTTKKAMLTYLGVNEKIKVLCGTHVNFADVSGVVPAISSQADDESVAASLREFAILMSECPEKGTPCCRATIVPHAGSIEKYGFWFPGIYWLGLKKAQYLSKIYIDQEPKERPNSEVTCFDQLSWRASSKDTQKRVWNYGISYFQSCDRTRLFCPSVRSVYPYDNSVFSDDSFTDAIIFVKWIIQEEWTVFAGSTDDTKSLQSRIYKKLMSRFTEMLNNKFKVTELKIYQLDGDEGQAYLQRIHVRLESPMQNRVWQATIVGAQSGLTKEV